MQTSAAQLFQSQLDQVMTGPEPHGICFCLHCRKEFGPNEQWLKHVSPDGSYSIGLHAACVMRNGFVRRGERVCSLCGYASKQPDLMTAHFATYHSVTDAQTVVGLLR
jgi:hypothetical protein